MDDLKGQEFLKKKLFDKKSRVRQRYRFYEMKNSVPDFGISTPPKLRGMKSVLGWCSRSVDALADRLQFAGFDGDALNMSSIYAANNADILMDSAILSALIASCCFIYISTDESGYPRMQVIDGANATGIIDPITMLLKEGYAVLRTDNRGKVITDAYFTPDYTEIRTKGEEPEIIDNPTGVPLLIPIVNRPDARRPFGHSRITRACMDIQLAASRTVKRSEISAEFYSFPQKYVLGMSEDAEIEDKWRATMSSLLTFTSDENGGHPSVGQFTQQSMTPHMDQLRMFASLFAAETGLTADDLGFVNDNPSSAESIKASHETLRLMARKAQRDFSVGFLNAGYLAACLRDEFRYQRRSISGTKVLWSPIFEPDASMLASIGDGVAKLNYAVPDYLGKKELNQLTGFGGAGND